MQPEYQLTNPYARILGYFNDSQPAGIGYKPNVGDKISDTLRNAYESLPGYDYVTDKGSQTYSSGLMDMLNRGFVAGTAGAPVDIANTLIGTRWPELQSEKPFMGSEWLGQKMQDYGMVSPVRRPIGEAVAGFADPETMGIAAAKLAALGKVAGAGHSLAMLPSMLGKAKPNMVLKNDVLKSIDLPIAKTDPIIQLGNYDLHRFEDATNMGVYPVMKGTKLPEFGTLDEAYEHADKVSNALINKYGFEDAGKFPTSAYVGGFSDLEVPKTNMTPEEISSLRAAFASVHKMKSEEYAKNMSAITDRVKQASEGFKFDKQSIDMSKDIAPVFKDFLGKADIDAAMGHTPTLTQNDYESLVRRIYAKLAEQYMPGATLLHNFDDAQDIMRSGTAGINVTPLFKQAKRIADEVLITPAKNTSKSAKDLFFPTEQTPLNSEGRPIHPTEDGVRNFWDWFGDSAVTESAVSSKQKRSELRPLVVYHGTRANFDAFAPVREGNVTTLFGDNETVARHGIFFAENPEFAGTFAHQAGAGSESFVPAYLSIQNPMYLDKGFTGEIINKLRSAGLPDDQCARLRHRKVDMSWAEFDGESGQALVRAAKSAGYDGAFMLEPGIGLKGEEQQNVWVAFDPEQIKSATGNTGAFNPTDPSIVKAKGGSVHYADGGRVGQYQLTDPYARILGYFDNSQPAGIGYKPNIGDKTGDALRKAYESLPGYDYVTDKGNQAYSSGLMDMLNRGLVAGTAGIPVDIANTVVGTRWPNLQTETPVGGSEWLGQKMQDYGMVSPVRRPLGEAAAGLIDPETLGIAAAKMAALGKVAGAGHSVAMLPGFFSKLERGLALAPEQALTSGNAAKQWLSANANKYGIKQAEIEATGIGAYLENLGKGKTSKENLLDVVKAGDPGIKEVVKGQPMSSEQQAEFEGLKNEITEIQQKYAMRGLISRDEARHLIDKAFENYGITEEEYHKAFLYGSGVRPTVIPAKHPTRVLPGGENYREVLLTLPSDDMSMAEKNLENEIANQQEIIRQTYSYAEKHPETAQRQFSYRENAIKKLNTATEELMAIKSKPPELKTPYFKSSHWEEPNVLAHFRTNDRIGPNGEKQLFVEELQSDWGQKGRRTGFDSDKPKYDALPDGYVVKSRKEINASGNESEFPRYWVEDTNGRKITAEGYSRQSVINDVITDLNDQARGTTESTVPSAPYITNTKDWTDLGIKRIMHHAAMNGYDQVAFINGAQSADRYDLSKKIYSVVVTRKQNGKFAYSAYKHRYDTIPLVQNNSGLTADELSEHLGKDFAEKVSNQHIGTREEYSGLDLRVGGEGMKKFYDEIVPQAAGKFAKQYGAPFGVKPMETGDQFTIDITPTMRKDIVEKGIPAFADGGSVHYADGGPINTDEDSYGQPFGDEIAKLYRGGSYADGGSVTDGATPYVPEQIDLLIKQLYEGL